VIRSGKPQKIHCEVCGEKRAGALEIYHVVHRADGGDDNYWNLAVLCANCHSRHHHGTLKIIGIYPSTDPVMARTVIYEEDGVNTSGITEPYYTPYTSKVKDGKEAKGTKQKNSRD